ncbi:MAG: glycosyltransferase family 39 protein [Byssovorax sp.]
MLRLRDWLARHAGLVAVTLLALAIRLIWNLTVHPPLDYRRSDMGMYLGRAAQMLDAPWTPQPYFTLFPYGTHLLVFGLKGLFGRENSVAFSVAFAATGALAVGYTFALAERLSPRRQVRWIAGLVLALYYPWISYSGLVLSETPFTLALAASAFYALRLGDRGRLRDAWSLGLALALGATFRPQILLSAALLGLHFLVRRRSWRGLTRGHVARVAAPIVLVLAASSVRLYWHTSTGWRGGQLGLISTNGPLNYAFGRCHATAITSDGGGYFSSPSLTTLALVEKNRRPRPIFPLDPVFEATAHFDGKMWEPDGAYALAHRCVEKSGYLVQARFALTHVVLLWAYNLPWPDSGQPARFRVPMSVFAILHGILILPPALLAIGLSLRRRSARRLLLTLHPLAMIATAMIYFGDARFRVPYDGLLIVLAAELVVAAVTLRRRRPFFTY